MHYNDLNMQIGNKKTGLKRTLPIGVLPINLKTIINLPLPNLYLEKDINIALREICKELLNDAMTRKDGYKHGEVGYLLRVNDDSTIDILYKAYGDYIHVPLSTDSEYRKIIKQYTINDDIIFIHNHPNNGDFSYGDFAMLIGADIISSIIAVGNRGNIYVMTKTYRDYNMYSCINSNIINDAIKVCDDVHNETIFRHCRDIIFKQYLNAGIIANIDHKFFWIELGRQYQ